MKCCSRPVQFMLMVKLPWMLILGLWWLSILGSAENISIISKPGCEPKCGNVTVYYPFGIGSACSFSSSFAVNCTTGSTPFLPKTVHQLLQISGTDDQSLRIKNSVAYSCWNSSGSLLSRRYVRYDLSDTPFTFSGTANRFTVVGCDSLALIQDSNGSFTGGCMSLCGTESGAVNGPPSCSGGKGCCQVKIAGGIKKLVAATTAVPASVIIRNSVRKGGQKSCSYGLLSDKDEDGYLALLGNNEPESEVDMGSNVPVVVDWAIGDKTCREAEKDSETFACQQNSYCQDSPNAGYKCFCKAGYQGNPYLIPGCQDVDECSGPQNPCGRYCRNVPGSFQCICPGGTYVNGRGCIQNKPRFLILQVTLGLGLGFIFLLGVISWVYLSFKKTKLIKLRENFFQKNGGLLLQQQIASHDGAMELTKIFKARELKKATDNYSESRVIGRGGYGTVYKAFLPDNRIVAVKKSKILDETQIEQFVNEVVILTRINHRNVVRLLGCCLETEVPILVYEFVSNGTLSHHIHHASFKLCWDKRLRIAIEAASALAYLHSAASVPIIHRDVKSANILLDFKYTAKVSDFGASRLIPIDQSKMTTLVQGTLGYLDPEYFYSGQLTEKSDVYSFGVVLVELLTGEMPVSFGRSETQRNLSSYFIRAMEENRILEIIETSMAYEGDREQIMAVAQLARKCLKLKAEKRPSMRQVVGELEGLLTEHQDERERLLNDDPQDLYPPPLDLKDVGSSAPYTGALNSMIMSLNLPR